MRTILDVDELVFNPPELGCVLYLPGPPGGGNKIFDCSPYGNHGTITGATWEKTVGGLGCLSFDGTDDYVDFGDGLDAVLTSSFSVEMWFQVSESKSWAILLTKSNNIQNLVIFGRDTECLIKHNGNYLVLLCGYFLRRSSKNLSKWGIHRSTNRTV